LALAATVNAVEIIPLQKRARVPLTAEQEMLVAAGHPVPLKGNIPQYGEYFVGFTIGTPGQAFEAQVDTGSSDLLINSVGCSGCGNGRKFNPAQSSTAKKVSCSQYNCATCHSNQCGFDDQYGDGSEVSGPVYTDVLNFPGSTLPATTIQFGATTQSSPNFEPTGVDGIFGLSYGALSSWGGVPPFERIVQQQGIPNVYSMCLTPSGGKLNLGYTAPSSTLWTPVIKKEWFVITVHDFSVNGQPLGYSAPHYADAIVDSGTTLLLLPNAPYNTLVSRVHAMCNQGVDLPGVCGAVAGHSIFDGYCYPMTAQQIKNFPIITASIPGWNTLTINPHDYLITNQGTYCWGIGNAGQGTILGDVAVQNQNIIYDMGNNRIGLAPGSTC
jgi:hypothetical protein